MSYNILAASTDFTVVSEYIPEIQNETAYQSEDALEKEFIAKLKLQGYEYLEIHKEEDLISNLRTQIENLNNIKFSDNEWEFLFTTYIANKNDGIIEKTRTIQEDEVKSIKLDNGKQVNIKLIDKNKLHNNKVQVINQYEVTGKRDNRYDVTILVNGLPLIHTELKRRGVQLKEAFNQINRYQRDSFWADSGLFEYIQIFVISNGTYTKYYSNTTRDMAVRTNTGTKSKKVSKSFEFTSYWADEKNNTITDLIDFTKTFFAKNTILKILTKYCVFTTEQQLMILRPYQIVAVEKIINKINMSTNLGCYSKPEAGGYLFHTTGSGKTLSSFVTAQRASILNDIDKVIFVVDRKDLDSQTISEYEKFQKGAVNGNSSTAELTRQLENKDKDGKYKEYKIIVTTIQKLGIFIKNNKSHDIYNKHVVIIFDECHRSQFGALNESIKKAFKKYHMFGFTGTPIYAKNKAGGKNLEKTTQQVFGDRLHAYTIVDAISDNNVLPFSIDYVNTFKVKDEKDDSLVEGIETKEFFINSERIKNNVEYILKNYDAKTKRKEHYEGTIRIKDGDTEIAQKKIMYGFNSLLACDSIQMAMKYYSEFKKQIKEKGSDLKIATIFSYGANDDEEEFDTSGLEISHRDFLEDAIRDYNIAFGTNFDTGKEFYNYYLDLTRRIKNNDVDITIVVNMLLTGFDSPITDVLWVDKKLEMHGLIQAFSRTNRILNSVKTYGKIICFRNLEENVNEALALYGDKEANGVVILKTFLEYLNGYETETKKGEKIYNKGYTEIVDDLKEKFPLPVKIIGEANEKEFIKLFGSVLRIRNILVSFDEFSEVDETILSSRDIQNYTSTYQDLRDKIKTLTDGDKETIYDDVVFETELIEQVAINIDYILFLIEKYHESNCKDKDLLTQINLAIGSSPQLRSKKDLIEKFYKEANIDNKDNIGDKWLEFIETQLDNELTKIITDEKLKPQETRDFINDCFRTGTLKTTGTGIDKILPPVSRFNKEGNKKEKKETVITKLLVFFDKFNNLLISNK